MHTSLTFIIIIYLRRRAFWMLRLVDRWDYPFRFLDSVVFLATGALSLYPAMPFPPPRFRRAALLFWLLLLLFRGNDARCSIFFINSCARWDVVSSIPEYKFRGSPIHDTYPQIIKWNGAHHILFFRTERIQINDPRRTICRAQCHTGFTALTIFTRNMSTTNARRK